MGFTAIVAQVVLIRELLTSFSGNELSIGIFFANWLLLEALGSYAAGRWADRVQSGIPQYVFLQLALSLTLPAIIYLTRIAKNLLGITPGQGIDVFTIFYSSFILLAPLGLADGAQFSFGCRIFAEGERRGAPSIGRVYVYEAIGSVFGGIVGTYICLQYLNAFQTVFFLAVLNLISALLLLPLEESKTGIQHAKNGTVFFRYGSLKIVPIAVLIICVLVFPLGGIDYLHKKSVQNQWPNYEILDYRNSVYGNVTLLKRFEQLNLMSNGIPVATLPTPDISFIEEVVHLSLLFHPHPQRVLLIGGGTGGVLQEILKHPIDRVDYAERDPLLIQTLQRHAASQVKAELYDSRVTVRLVDGRYFVRTTSERYDIILINLPDPSTLEINRFYTLEFFQMSRKRLKRGGFVCFLLPGSVVYMKEEIINLNANLIETAKSVLPYLRIIPGDYNLVLASADSIWAGVNPDTLTRRRADRSLQTLLLSDFHIRYKLDEARLQWFENEIRKADRMSLNRDFHPLGLYYDLAFWSAIHSPGFARIFHQLKHFRLLYIIPAIGLFFALFLYLQHYWAQCREFFVVMPIMATGFVGMGVDVLLVLAFQSFYGYIYHWIGLLITAFMVGLTFGGMWITRRLEKATDDCPSFLRLEILLFIYVALLIGALALMNSLQEHPLVFSSIPFILLGLNALCGFLVGAEFPLANKIYLERNPRYSHTAGILYAADLVGAWIGALLVTLVCIPIFGIMNTGLLILIVKLGSLWSFYVSRR